MKATRSDSRFPPILPALLIVLALATSCSDDPSNPTAQATVKGTLTVPESATGHEYAVVIDDDLDGTDVIAYCQGSCNTGTEISYSIPNIAKGTYYLYGIVRLVSNSRTPPEEGDL